MGRAAGGEHTPRQERRRQRPDRGSHSRRSCAEFRASESGEERAPSYQGRNRDVAVPVDLPTWIDNPWVVAVLVGRIAIGSGAGGTGRLMTAASIAKLLADPARLADELEAMLGKVDAEGEAVRQLKEAVKKMRTAVRGTRHKNKRTKTKG
jgi:hypothetical protein